MALFVISDLNVKINETQILSNVSCEIPENRITVILGPSGSGKTTLLKSIVRLVNSNGNILMNNLDTREIQIAEMRKNVVYVSQIPSMFSGTVYDNIIAITDISEIEVFPSDLIEMVGLSKDILYKNASELSVGQQQRVHLARSLALKPKVLLLDEPASALDAISKEGIEQLVSKLVKSNSYLSIIIVTHDINQAKSIADYIILIDKGKTVLEGLADDFMNQVNSLNEADTLRWLLKARDIKKEETQNGH